MMKRKPIRSGGEDGYMIVAVMFMLALLVLSMAVAAPRVRDDIQRDRDLETMHRGKQYIRAIQLYYRKFNAYPPNVDALVKTNEIRFLRKKYVDPTTGKDEWKPVLFGQNKTPTAIGFFGQPLGGSSIAGIGPSGGNGLGGANGGNGLNPGGTSSLFNSGPGSTFGSNNSGNATNPTDPNAAGGNGLPGANGTGTGGTDASGAAAGGPGNGASGPGTGTGGQSFGGAGIIGFSPGSPKQSILVYKKKNHYNEWEFTYDPIQERMQAGMTGGNTGAIGQPASSTTTPVGGIGPTATPVPAPAPTNTPQ